MLSILSGAAVRRRQVRSACGTTSCWRCALRATTCSSLRFREYVARQPATRQGNTPRCKATRHVARQRATLQGNAPRGKATRHVAMRVRARTRIQLKRNTTVPIPAAPLWGTHTHWPGTHTHWPETEEPTPCAAEQCHCVSHSVRCDSLRPLPCRLTTTPIGL